MEPLGTESGEGVGIWAWIVQLGTSPRNWFSGCASGWRRQVRNSEPWEVMGQLALGRSRMESFRGGSEEPKLATGGVLCD